MDKKPYYRQSAIVFAFLAAIFLCLAIELIARTGWLFVVTGVLAAAVVIYAIVSAAKLK